MSKITDQDLGKVRPLDGNFAFAFRDESGCLLDLRLEKREQPGKWDIELYSFGEDGQGIEGEPWLTSFGDLSIADLDTIIAALAHLKEAAAA